MHYHNNSIQPASKVRVHTSDQSGLVRWGQSGAATVLANPEQLEYIKALFVFRQGDAVREFLSIRPHLIAPLIQAHSFIWTWFPEDWAALRVLVDPEEAGEPDLGIYIVTQLDASEAVERFDRLLDQWIDSDSIVDSELIFNLEFA